MSSHKFTIKDMDSNSCLLLIEWFKSNGIVYDLEILDDNLVFDEETKEAYKVFKKSLERQKEELFKKKYKIN
jgi:hypothetical protein